MDGVTNQKPVNLNRSFLQIFLEGKVEHLLQYEILAAVALFAPFVNYLEEKSVRILLF